jgi:hypothetical protein
MAYARPFMLRGRGTANRRTRQLQPVSQLQFPDAPELVEVVRHQGQSGEQAVAVITRFYPLERFPPKTLYALGELLPKRS